MADGEKSVGWVIIALMVAIAWLGWSFVAAAYAHSEQGWRTGGAEEQPNFSPGRIGRRAAMADFLINGFEQIPNFFSVTKFAFTQRLWLVGIFAGLEVGTLFWGWKMKQMEADFAKPRRKRI